MFIRSRSARFAALALAITTPVVAASALPAFAAGESASATLTSPASGSATTFTWNYTFDQNGGNGLSNIAIGFCSADILSDVVSAGPSADIFTNGDVVGGHDGFGPGIKFGVTATTGTLTVTFGHEHPIADNGLRIQSHSGGGQTGDATKTTKGPGPCPSDDAGGGSGGSGGTGGTGGGSGGSGGSGGTGGSGGSGGSGGTGGTGGSGGSGGTDGGSGTNGGSDTVVAGETLENNGGGSDNGTTQTPASAVDPTLTTAATPPATSAPTVNPSAGTTVSGVELTAGAELPRTGTGHVQFLIALALSLLAAGITLRAAFGRRIRSASSPG